MIKKVLLIILGIVFLLFTYVQFNDPDPEIWVMIYGSVALVCIWGAFRNPPYVPMLILTILFVLYSLMFVQGAITWLQSDNKADLFDDLAKMQNLYIEETREFLGLVLCIITLTGFLIAGRKRA